jgi:hypothetical protein
VNNIQAVPHRAQRSFCELLARCELGAVISRIAAAVAHFFTVIARFICCYSQEQVRGGRSHAVEAATTISAEEISDVMSYVLQLIPDNRNRQYREAVVQAVTAIPVGERNDVVQHALLFSNGDDHLVRFTDIFVLSGIHQVLSAIRTVPSEERNEVRYYALPLIGAETDYKGKADIINALAAIPAGERNEIMHYASLFTPYSAFLCGKADLIRTLTAIPADVRNAVIHQALRLITNNCLPLDKILILDVVQEIPANERENFIQQALRIITPEMSGFHIVMMLEELVAVPVHERANFVWNPPPEVHHPVPARATDVHEGDRDQRVRAAIRLLRKEQGEIAKERIEQAIAEFKAYIESDSMNATREQLARDALSKPKGDEGFGPLLGGGGFTVIGVPLTGEEVIGRLWIYASDLKGAEQTNAKQGMISALQKSYEHDARVCNQGKTQRLMIAVLQGRLKGVDVDGVPLTRQQAAAAFLEAHRDIQVRTQLLAAAPLFRPTDIHMNRRELIEDIHTYADQAEIPSLKEEFIQANPHVTVAADLIAAANRFCDLNPLIERAPFLADIEAYAVEKQMSQTT